tara:strand:- start:2021 stop:2389 length:369 start_codon:yes stop_codon:yes gene_type:complete
MVSFGVIVFFSFVVAPITFITLDIENAGKFIRRLFPFYYGFNLFCLILSLLIALVDGSFAVRYHIVILCVILFLFTLFYLLPKINKYRDSSNERMFKITHRLSVVINYAQLILLAIIASGYY